MPMEHVKKIEFAEPMPVQEIVQAGDVFLVKFHCDQCHSTAISGIENLHCADCKVTWPNRGILDPGRFGFRCLAGTKRKSKTISKKMIRFLFDMQNGECAYCFSTMENYHIEHITPISFGGTNNLSNLVLSCPPCNLVAGSAVFSSLEAKRQFICRKRFKTN